jgi:cytochrome c-type biogenesis protein CcsB
MTLFESSNQSFNVASILYALAFLLYAGQLVSEKKLYTNGSSWMARAAFFMHTLALGLRWAHSGLGHPPWTNLYESLVFFSWGVMGAHLFLELRFGFKLTGVFATAVVFAAMGVASLHPHKEVEPLVPALQSWWLLFHVFMACIAYAFFLAASFVSVFYLLKDKVKLELMAAVAALVCVLFLVIAVGKEFFLTGQIQFFKVLKMAGPDGVMKDVIMNFKGPDGKPIRQFVSAPGAPYFVWPLLTLYLAAAGALFSKKRKFERWGKIAFVAALVIHVGFLIDILAAARMLPDLSLKSNPYRLAGVIMTLGISAFFACLFRFQARILARLPEAEVLDRWGYEAILLGVPFMTINLISGGVWAYYAWGRYWGWDPKETWAFITWSIYVIYLHMRILGGWKGRKTALISVFGFFVVIFTYLGVNLVVSGLHSYATG